MRRGRLWAMDDTSLPPPVGSHMFQITEDDLADLERTIPDLLSRAMASMDNNRARTQIRRVQDILMNIRWNYGPWGNVTTIPADSPVPDA
jgi:hypothetical protein